ncbi:TetR/AcrR family transcriptional regulator [Pseudomonas gingeri]|uniref:TetR/AcrR family transcriptional regulator n=1 Tax=Pseudomonas gingeri TaxID=117681 RepID=A0A7Y7YJ70_9PSED|nr:TetR/AcrR family transcriptional regulator [Pseudomonas gingeri]NWA02781.1 TetR/AcrR family transcriptional regulator [Pseudomonas gingeri]NWA18258.1 TetR/AcrR family transcriptional regulator [Pseudomonas gingeri]NWA58952.1 TetR/AcrR family transcriptional regulator [Pseudomonas gingeri]NWA99531.1 TetR/AcrR family transcriptional regulator [Pseudomonas gingeri]NWB05536.1 TetR/AcrR family transcriptional regulator [Pseudomonas gingeri]
MPRVSRKQAELNREIITDAAARLFRERGLKGLSVIEVMGAAGLTHGGFYGHFDSKEALAAEACGRSFEQSTERWQQRTAEAPSHEAARQSIVEHYLSTEHRDNPGAGCPVVAFCGDLAHEDSDSAVRQSYVEGLEKLVGAYSALLDSPEPEARKTALVQYSLLVGALSLARSTRGRAISDEILEAAHAALLPANG